MNHEPKPPESALFVLFGAMGDLSWRLIMPALFNLHLDGMLPEHFIVFGVDRKEFDDARLADHYLEGISNFSRRGKPNEAEWQSFSQMLRYVRADLTDQGEFNRLADLLNAQEKLWHNQAERIFYMATPPGLFEPIATGLGKAGLAKHLERARIVIEKPIGHDLASSRQINRDLSRYFAEDQIYRIDHFLGKETVQNILVMRFANPMFEPIWNRRYIDHVAITVGETLGVEHRSSYYEKAGALRDMVQNHLFQLLCLVAMEPPVAYDANDIRDKKLDVLRAIRPIPKDAVHDYAARGQYGSGWINGTERQAYRDEPGVDPTSNTETFAALKLYVDNWRWQGVPFYLRTGKRMAADVSEISIRFQEVPHRAFPPSVGLNTEPSRLVIQIQPDQGIVQKFTAKEPGSVLRLRPVNMHFSYQETFQKAVPDAYETLLWDIMRGDATLFMRADQVEAAWALLMPVIEVWQENQAPDFPNYAAGSWGPESAEVLAARGGDTWLIPTKTMFTPEKP